MIHRLALILPLAILLCGPTAVSGQTLWSNPDAARGGADAQRYRLDEALLRERLLLVPHESRGNFSAEIELPLPDGGLGRFQVVESPIMQDQLAAAFPEFKSYRVFGIDDPMASGRISLSPRGLHGLLITAQGRLYLDPEDAAAGRYLARAGALQAPMGYRCAVDEIDQSERPAMRSGLGPPAARVSGMLLEYVIAVAATEEYVTAVAAPGDVAGAQLEIAAAINRVNVIYERDHGVRLTLVGGNQNLIEDGGNVSFSNSNPFAILGENQAWIDSEIGSGNYDIGHVFSTGSGGLASLGSVCDSLTKAQGVSGLPNPTGDPFYITLVSHEIGHQFNADHSFNGTTSNCSGNRNASTAWEPGSGSSIMAYSGICAAENLQISADATFHAGSIAQVDSFTAGAGACGTQIDTSPANNSDPVITAIPDYTIPADTPFQLSGSATDAESGTALLYQWDQMDAGTETTSSTLGQDLDDNALFRSYEPSLAMARRDFPALGTQVRGLYDQAETIPCQSRDVNLRLTVRDDDSGQASEDVRIRVTDNAGPFALISHTSAVTEVGDFIVVWDVADTSLTPVSCANVDIDLIAFNDAAYSRYSVHRLATATANVGSRLITQPADSLVVPARGRLRVKCNDNVFYALSQADVFIFGSNAPQTFFDNDDNATFNPASLTSTTAPECPVIGGGGGGGDGGDGGGGGYTPPRDAGSIDPWWLMLLAAAGVVLRRLRSLRSDSGS